MDDHIQIQDFISNRLDRRAIGARRIAGVIGATPSQYSKSPALWNAAFQALGMDAIYVAMDIEKTRLRDLFTARRRSDRVLGINVTVPHKLDVMQYLDAIDPGAARIGAVNTIARSADGRLLGYNTDGQGFIESILVAMPGESAPFMDALDGCAVLLLGAGGSARALAYALANQIKGAPLSICNRTLQPARELAEGVAKTGGRTRAIGEDELEAAALSAGLIVNSTTKGQGGVQQREDGTVLSMEFYSSLASANPMPVPRAEYGRADSTDVAAQASAVDIRTNQQASLRIAEKIHASTRFYDLIYHPEETVFLRHARQSGHRTMNGRQMIICQAVAAFCDHICAAELRGRPGDNAAIRAKITEVMHRAW
jgi:shikimate dehydrogenase